MDEFVTVFLVEAKAHTVVPKKCVYKLLQVNLDNNGLNSNQNRRIYFSKQLFEALQNDEVPEENFEPNFIAPIVTSYPLPNEVSDACYIARLKKFWRKYRKTKNCIIFKEKFYIN